MPAPPRRALHGSDAVQAATGIEPARIRFYQANFQDFLGPAGDDGDTFDDRQVALLARIDQHVFKAGLPLLELRNQLLRERRVARIVTVTSGKGGVGKTTVSINLAIAAAAAGRRTLLVDADFGLANVHVFAGIEPRATIADLLDSRKPLDEVLTAGPGGIEILCGGSGVTRLANMDAGDMEHLGRQLSRLAERFDLVIMDTGAGISASVVHCLGVADDIVVVATPDIAALLDAYGVIKVSRQAEVTGKIHLLINQVRDPGEFESAASRICTCAERFLHVMPNVLGYLPRDPALQRANQQRAPLVCSRPRTANAARFRRIAADLLAGAAPHGPAAPALPPRMEAFVAGLRDKARADRPHVTQWT